MKTRCSLMALALALGAIAAAPRVMAQEGKTVLTGMVSVSQDDEGVITAATLTVTETAEEVAIKLDAKGRELAKAADCKTAKVTGAVSEAGGQKTITVQSFSVVEEGGNEF